MIYTLYKNYSKKYLKYDEKQRSANTLYAYTLIKLYANTQFVKQYKLKSLKMSAKDCKASRAKEFLLNLIKIDDKQDSTYYSRVNHDIFNKDFNTYKIVKILHNSCKNLNKETSQVLKRYKGK